MKRLNNLSSNYDGTICDDSQQLKPLKPFLKWPGGKQWIAKKLASFISKRLSGCYYEPFLGGGAVFFALRPKHAILSDINENLINVYQQVANNPISLLEKLKHISVDSKTYYEIRDSKPECPIEKAVRFLYLNRTAFGGIYRLNRQGKFNVPYGGGQRTPEPLWRNGLLLSASDALQGAKLHVMDFKKMMKKAKSGDIVYCDPTYTVAHERNGFIRYNEKNFSWRDQRNLAKEAKLAWKRGAIVLVSNACNDHLLDLYKPFEPVKLTRKSLVSPSPAARQTIHEYLFILSHDEQDVRTEFVTNCTYP